MINMKVQELLQKYSGKDACLLLPEGNKGDGLIYMGAITLLKKYGVEFTEIRYPHQISGKTLFVLGSGGFCGPYHRMPEIIGFYMDRFEEIIIYPSSFDIRCDVVRRFIKNLPKKAIVFCRERYSYKQVLHHIPYKKNVFLDHDLAFNFNYDKWRRQGKGRLNAFRLDRESLRGRYIPNDNYDVSLSKEGRGETLQERKWDELLEGIAGYEEVRTDRAHVAIASAMLGKRTYVYPNTYHKIKGIYEYSLADLPNVKWAGIGYKILFTSLLVLRTIKLLAKKARRTMTRVYLSPLILLYCFIKKDDITIVLAIKDIDDNCLINCLTTIRRQTYNQSLVEIAVVDYDSQARPGLLYKKACERFHAKYIRASDRPVWCKANALNIGIKRARTKYILSADADIIFEKNYIEEGIKELKKRPFQVIVNAALDLPDILINDKTYDELKLLAAPRYNLKYSTGINLTFTDFYHRIRGYDEEYKIYAAEDDDLIKRFKLLGLAPRCMKGRTSYLHQYHEKFRGVKNISRLKDIIAVNRRYLNNTNTIVRNRAGWGGMTGIEGSLPPVLRKKFLAFSSVGDKRNVNYWVNKNRIYDVCLAYYGNSGFDGAESADFFIKNADYKIPNFLRCLERFDELLEYDYYFFIDDDLIIEHNTIEEVFRAAERYRLDLCQPSLTSVGKKLYWPGLMNNKHLYMTYTNFVEIGCFCVSRGLLQKTLSYFYFIKSGAGLDMIFSKVLEGRKDRIAVLHFLQIVHPYRPKEETVKGLIPNFGEDFLKRDRRIRFCLGMWETKKYLIEDFHFKVYKTICKKDAGIWVKTKCLLNDISNTHKLIRVIAEYCWRRLKKLAKITNERGGREDRPKI